MAGGKLVRDKIPEIIRAKGGEPATHLADDEEYGQRLKAKLVEEAGEFYRDGSEMELADILEVVEAICAFKGVSLETVRALQIKKSEERGGFLGRVILEE